MSCGLWFVNPELGAVALGVRKWSRNQYLHAWCLCSFQCLGDVVKYTSFLIHVSSVKEEITVGASSFSFNDLPSAWLSF